MEHLYDKKVLVIDDQYVEVEPIISSMARNGVATVYWNGLEETRPVEPYKNIRLVFIDMQFITGVAEEQTVISNMLKLLKEAVSVENGPYILIVWSKHINTYYDAFEQSMDEMVKTEYPKPITIVKMDKHEFLEVDYSETPLYTDIKSAFEDTEIWERLEEILEDYDQDSDSEIRYKSADVGEKIYSKILDEINRSSLIKYMTVWEYIVHKSVSKSIHELFVAEIDDPYDKNVPNILTRLAEGYIGEGHELDKNLILSASMKVLSSIIHEEIVNELNRYDFSTMSFECDETLKFYMKYNGKLYHIQKKKSTYKVFEDGRKIEEFKTIDDVTEERKDICNLMRELYLSKIGMINAKIFTENFNAIQKQSGLVFKVNDEAIKDGLALSLKKSTSSVTGDLVAIDITSSCNYAQKNIDVYRVLYGMLVNEEQTVNIKEKDYIIKSPLFKIGDATKRIVFHSQYLSFCDESLLHAGDKLFYANDLYLNKLREDVSKLISSVGILELS